MEDRHESPTADWQEDTPRSTRVGCDEVRVWRVLDPGQAKDSAEADGSLRRGREWESSAANVRSASCRSEKNRLGVPDMGPPNKKPFGGSGGVLS